MDIDEADYCDLKIFIYSAVESEQAEPAELKLETEMRLALVFRHLNTILGLPEDYNPDCL